MQSTTRCSNPTRRRPLGWVLGLTSLSAFISACASEKLAGDPAELDASPPAAARPALKQAPFGVQPGAKPSAVVAPLKTDATRYRSGELIVKLRTPLVQVESLRDYRSVSARNLADAARDHLPRLETQGVRLKAVSLLYPPRRRAPSAAAGAAAALDSVRTYLIAIDDPAADMPEIARRFAARPDVEWAEPNWIRQTTAVPNDPLYAHQWHHPAVDSPAAWDTTKGAKHIVVGVLDTGIVYDHPDLAANVWNNAGEIAGDGLDNDDNGFVDDVRGWDFGDGDADPRDELFHGTHVSGIVGAVGNDGFGIAGVAWNVRIMPVKLAAPGGGLFDSAIVAGIHYAVDNGADILNMSFGGLEPSEAVREAVRYAADRDVLPVVSAGNDSGRGLSFPAAHPEVLAVAALDESGSLASYSNFGSFVDVAAPGSNILSTLDGGWGYASGTSMAAPVVAGLAALVKSAHPDFSANALRYQILSTARDLTALNPEHAPKLGSGKASAVHAIGAFSSAPWVSLLEHGFAEASGDGDGEFEAGESVALNATIGGFADAANVTVTVSTNDPWLDVTTPAQSATVRYGGTAVATLAVSVKPGVPADHTAGLTLNVRSGALERSWPLSLVLAPSYRNRYELPATLTPSFSKLPESKLAFVYDNLDWRSNGHWRVYGSIRQASGAFTSPVVLSDPTTDAANSKAAAAPDGDVHTVYRQFDATHDFPQLVYVRYDAETGTWSPREPITSSDDAPNWFSVVTEETIAVDAQGRVHVAWYDFNRFTGSGQVRTAVRTASGWEKSVIFSAQGFAEGFCQLLPLPNGNLGFFYTLGQGSELQLAEWDGAAWGASRRLVDGVLQSAAKLPFRLGDSVYRFQADGGFSEPYQIARLGDDTWTPLRIVSPTITNDTRHSELAFHAAALDDFTIVEASFSGQKRLVRNVAGSETSLALRLHPTDLADRPVLGTDADGNHHILVRGYVLTPGLGPLNSYSSYLTNAPVDASLRPATPVVNDGGSVTTTPQITVSWSTAGGATPEFFRVGVGTVPGGDDVLRFKRTAGAQTTLDLGSFLEAGRTYYVSVRAIAAGFYESETGSSDGILFNPTPRCTADAWNPTITYREAGIQVTHNGNTYRNKHFHAGNAPSPSSASWTLVGPCSGAPAPSVCEFPAWNTSKAYSSGDVVTHGGREFLSLWYNQGQVPTSVAGNAWLVIGVCAAK